MRKIFPFNASATNIYMLIAITMSYICFPILGFLTVHTACVFLGVSTYNTQFSAATAFLIVGIYSIIGIITMYVSYYKVKKQNKF